MSNEHAREHRRHQMRAKCIVRSASDGRLLADRTLDVSYSGVRLAALGPVSLGERVQISLELPRERGAKGAPVWIEASGRIARVIEGRRAGDEGAAVGVRIDRLDGMRRLLLASVARDFPEAARSRGAARDYAGSIARIAAGA